MSSELLEGRLAPTESEGMGMGPLNQPPRHTQPLPCPRCNSINTKFCYYNNYNSSQPRYFCKTCRRYWTHGGTLRNVPVGGGTRKKRCRPNVTTTSSPTSTATTATSLSVSSCTTTATSALASSAPTEFVNSDAMASGDSNLNEKLSTVAGSEENGNFLSLLKTRGIYVPGFGFMGINNNGGYGPSFGLGACEMGRGFDGNGVFPYAGMAYNGGVGSIPTAPAAGAPGGGHSDLSASEASQLRDVGRTIGDGWVDDADCFVWPELAISMPGAKV